MPPQPTSLRLPLRDLQPLLPPDPLHPLVVHRRLTGSIFDHISGAIVSPFQFSGNGWYSVNG